MGRKKLTIILYFIMHSFDAILPVFANPSAVNAISSELFSIHMLVLVVQLEQFITMTLMFEQVVNVVMLGRQNVAQVVTKEVATKLMTYPSSAHSCDWGSVNNQSQRIG